jgi:hypothetical protein
MTWGQALTGLIVLTVVGAGIAYGRVATVPRVLGNVAS